MHTLISCHVHGEGLRCFLCCAHAVVQTSLAWIVIPPEEDGEGFGTILCEACAKEDPATLSEDDFLTICAPCWQARTAREGGA